MKLSSVLKEKTKVSHHQLENFLVKQLKSLSSVDDYQHLLKSFYGYIHPLEKLINQQMTLELVSDYPDRRKSGSLANDLKQLGSRIDSDSSADLPQVDDKYRALGAMYVLEGSTLGGQIITRMLRQKLNIQDDTGLEYFSSYGDRVPDMWMKFQYVLDNYGFDEEQQEEVVRAAEDTFKKFKKWLQYEYSK